MLIARARPMAHDSAYGLWSLVVVNLVVFIAFAFSFARPQRRTDWRSFGALRGNPHLDGFHLASFALLASGFWLLGAAWPVLYRAQRQRSLATSGPYAHVRHPQYVGFVLILTGFLLQWPTLLTLAMYPVLLVMYVRLALHEERDAQARFTAEYDRYASRTPRFIPNLGRQTEAA